MCSSDLLFLAMFSREDSEKGLGEHGQGDMSIPGVVEPNLVVVEPDVSFPGVETFLDWPAGTGDPDQFARGFVAGVVAMVEGEFGVVDGSSDHVLMAGLGGVDDRPVVDSVAFGSDSTGAAGPCVGS